MSDIAMLTGTVDPSTGMVIQPDRRMARFENVPTLNAQRSQEVGRPIYESKVVLFVRHPGERDETAVAAQEQHKYEFPRQWAAFEAGQKVDPDGTPLSVLFPMDPTIVQHLRGLHFFTVEMLAGAGEEGIRRIGMGAREYVSRAQKLIEASEKAAPVIQANARIQAQDEEIALLKEQIAMLAASKRRPRKNADEGDEE